MNKIILVLFFMVPLFLMAQGNALDFDGVDDCVTISNDFNLDTSYTAECWINADALSGGNSDQSTYGFTVMSSSYEPSVGYPLWITVYGTEVRVWSYEQTNDAHRTTSGANLTTGTWFHIAVTATHSGNTTVYVNGTSRASYTNDGDVNWSTIFTVGDLRPDRFVCFDGKIDEVRIWDDIRTQTEIEDNMDNTLTGSESNLVGYWKFDESSGSNASDYSGNNYDGTLTNMDPSTDWVTSDAPLPVMLSIFSATYTDETLTINWTTELEYENSGWNIYRGLSQDAMQNNETIIVNSTLIPGNGTTNQSSNYEYIDENLVVAGSTYWYWLEDVSNEGETEIHSPTSIIIPDGDTPQIPVDYKLQQNYPNPFNPSTTISFELINENSEATKLVIYNLHGQKVKTLLHDMLNAGIHQATWDGKDELGNSVSSGLYFYTLHSGNFSETKKMILMK